MTLRERYITNAQGERTNVLLSLPDYQRLQARLADLAALAAHPPPTAPLNLETERQLRDLFATLTEEEIDEAEAGEGPYVWLIDILDELGCQRLAAEAEAEMAADGGKPLAWESVKAEIESAWGRG